VVAVGEIKAFLIQWKIRDSVLAYWEVDRIPEVAEKEGIPMTAAENKAAINSLWSWSLIKVDLSKSTISWPLISWKSTLFLASSRGAKV
jgi:hypothetical protein